VTKNRITQQYIAKPVIFLNSKNKMMHVQPQQKYSAVEGNIIIIFGAIL
jgi:hypothetical protein